MRGEKENLGRQERDVSFLFHLSTPPSLSLLQCEKDREREFARIQKLPRFDPSEIKKVERENDKKEREKREKEKKREKKRMRKKKKKKKSKRRRKVWRHLRNLQAKKKEEAILEEEKKEGEREKEKGRERKKQKNENRQLLVVLRMRMALREKYIIRPLQNGKNNIQGK